VFLHNNKGYSVLPWTYDSFDHNIHHHYGQQNYNFGLFFKFWDWGMGTYKDSAPSAKKLQKKVD